MSKRGGFPGGMGGFGGMNLNQLMKEAKKMQADIEKSQEELGNKEFSATAGGGAIEVVDPEDVEMLQDLIITCINEAMGKVDNAQASELGKYNIPGMM